MDASDPFDPVNLRLSQDFTASVGVKKVLTTVRVRKPGKQEFIRVRPGAEWRIETADLEDQHNRESYLVEKSLWQELAGEITPVCLFLAITRQGNVFLWRCRLPGPDGRSNPWYDSALAAVRLAETNWVRVASNMPAGMYDTFEATGELSDPEWSDLSFTEILRLAYRDQFIKSLDHPILQALRGER